MEGSKGIVMEARTPVAVAMPKRTISGAVADAPRAKDTATANAASSPKQKEVDGKIAEIDGQNKRTALPNAEQTPSQNADSEHDPLAEKKELIMELVDLLGQNLSEEAREAMKRNLIESFSDNDEKKGKPEKDLLDMLAEMTRLIAILMALFLLMIRSPKDTYSGKDLALPNNAPEGESDDKLTKAMFGKTIQESWRNFREEVDKIEDVPFSELMSRVLAANAKNAVKKIRVKPEGRSSVLDRMRKIRMGGFGRKSGLVRRAAPAASGRSK